MYCTKAKVRILGHFQQLGSVTPNKQSVEMPKFFEHETPTLKNTFVYYILCIYLYICIHCIMTNSMQVISILNFGFSCLTLKERPKVKSEYMKRMQYYIAIG